MVANEFGLAQEVVSINILSERVPTTPVGNGRFGGYGGGSGVGKFGDGAVIAAWEIGPNGTRWTP